MSNTKNNPVTQPSETASIDAPKSETPVAATAVPVRAKRKSGASAPAEQPKVETKAVTTKTKVKSGSKVLSSTATVKAPAMSTVKAKPKADKPVREKKPKLVRDSFTIPKAEYLVLDELKLRAAKLASPVKKSELLRAGIKALAALSDADFLVAVKAVPAIKTGRPAKT